MLRKLVHFVADDEDNDFEDEDEDEDVCIYALMSSMSLSMT
jgi:hypothetical protein